MQISSSVWPNGYLDTGFGSKCVELSSKTRNAQVKRNEFEGINSLRFEQRVENKWYQV